MRLQTRQEKPNGGGRDEDAECGDADGGHLEQVDDALLVGVLRWVRLIEAHWQYEVRDRGGKEDSASKGDEWKIVSAQLELYSILSSSYPRFSMNREEP